MILQNIILSPVNNNSKENELYFRKSGLISFSKNNLSVYFEKNSKITFDTYFNSFSYQKWIKYTTLKNLSINLSFKGKFKISIINHNLHHCNSSKDYAVIVKEFQCKNLSSVNIEIPGSENYGMLHIELESLGENGEFKNGYFFSEDFPKINDIKLALVFCTFKREQFIQKNISTISNYLSQNKNLARLFKIFVIDNGKTISKKIENENVKLFYNKNTGGSGGFTRGIIEVLNSKVKFSHFLLMDDDVEIQCESIVRTISFLSVLKDEYDRSVINGSMLRSSEKYIQHENSALWCGSRLKYIKYSLDLSEYKNVIKNEIEVNKKNQYAGWWYACFPLKNISLSNLPLPFFVRGDDIEYSLRNTDKILNLNGICVWHEPFENKKSFILDYYLTVRNHLVLNTFQYGFRLYFKNILLIFYRITLGLALYEYDNIKLVFNAFEDYIKGPEILECDDYISLFQEKNKILIKPVDINELKIKFDLDNCKNNLFKKEKKRFTKLTKLFSIITLNGYFIPSIFLKRLSYANYGVGRKFIENFGYKNIFYYDKISGKVLHRKIKKFFLIKYYFKFLLIMIKYLFISRKIRKEYCDKFPYYTGYNFWEKYLDLRE